MEHERVNLKLETAGARRQREATTLDVHGRSWRGGPFVFSRYVPHGQGERRIEVEVPAEVIATLAAILQHTGHAGHAAYHFNNPQDPLPCLACVT